MKKLKRFRVGDIELRVKKDSNYAAEIVKWQVNPYYGHLDEYEQSKMDPDCYRPKDKPYGFIVHESCFKNPESCYVVAFVMKGGEEADILSVGKRPWELNDDDADSYRCVIDYIFK